VCVCLATGESRRKPCTEKKGELEITDEHKGVVKIIERKLMKNKEKGARFFAFLILLFFIVKWEWSRCGEVLFWAPTIRHDFEHIGEASTTHSPHSHENNLSLSAAHITHSHL